MGEWDGLGTAGVRRPAREAAAVVAALALPWVAYLATAALRSLRGGPVLVVEEADEEEEGPGEAPGRAGKGGEACTAADHGLLHGNADDDEEPVDVATVHHMGRLRTLSGSRRKRRRTLTFNGNMTETEGPLAPHSTNPWWIDPLLGWLQNGAPAIPVPCPLDNEEIVVHAFGAETKAAHFPLLDQDFAYLNHGSYGACLSVCWRTKLFWSQRLELLTSRHMEREVLPLLCNAQRALAAFVHAEAADLAFVNNATEGCNAVINSLEVGEGDFLLCTNVTYGAVKNALDLKCLRSGATLLQLCVALPLDIAALRKQVHHALRSRNGRVRLAVFDLNSSVPSSKFPVSQLSDICHDYGCEVLVDGAHGVGMFALNVPALKCDYFASNCHKWLCTPKGTAFLWVRKELQAKIRPTVTSHGYSCGFACEFMWKATMDYSGFLAVPAAIRFFQAYGPDAIFEHNHKLVCWAAEMLAAAWGTRVLTPREHNGTLASVQVPDSVAGAMGATELDTTLRAQGIESKAYEYAGSMWIRLSAHVFNEKDDYRRLQAAVLRLAASPSGLP